MDKRKIQFKQKSKTRLLVAQFWAQDKPLFTQDFEEIFDVSRNSAESILLKAVADKTLARIKFITSKGGCKNIYFNPPQTQYYKSIVKRIGRERSDKQFDVCKYRACKYRIYRLLLASNRPLSLSEIKERLNERTFDVVLKELDALIENDCVDYKYINVDNKRIRKFFALK